MPSTVPTRLPNAAQKLDKSKLYLFIPNFLNIRRHFKVFKVIDIERQMLIIQLPIEKSLVIDTVDMSDRLRREIDSLTNNGDNIEAGCGSSLCNLFEKYDRVVQGWNVILTNPIKICQTSLYTIYLNDIIQYQYLVCRSLLDLIKESKNKNWHIPILILTLTGLRLLTNYFTINISTDINGRTSPPTQHIAKLSINNDRQISETHVNKTIELLTEAFHVFTSDRCTEQRLSKNMGSYTNT
ncbi:unnamed protein product [Rotaria sp. Silwood1]|nr:unnamed protein product [Rotaria sp. Silwood1]CAF1659795.1 unnamed protein product [Rotaria sp. Silwood1]CAF3828483.1 unnamed protein product [Rotaria sp. Silwood1]CAF3882171.1 unnamed protein product [Rotaria sp. Silwood1]CAF3981304.1 unnamed protein product [Rotaria sp. Silwood1]